MLRPFTISLILLSAFISNGCSRPADDGAAASTPVPAANSYTASDASGTFAAATGVPACDEAIALLRAELDLPDENDVARAMKAAALGRIEDKIRLAIDQHKADRSRLAARCREIERELTRYKPREAVDK
ncbi:MAG: hypothetical protein ACK4S4_04745 [Pyrinomonadaceae bacterium]